MVEKSPLPSGTREMPRLTMPTGLFPSMRDPWNSTFPEEGRSKPVRVLRIVDLPAPFDPMIEKTSPSWTSKLTSQSAWASP